MPRLKARLPQDSRPAGLAAFHDLRILTAAVIDLQNLIFFWHAQSLAQLVWLARQVRQDGSLTQP